MNVHADQLLSLTQAILLAWGMRAEDAKTTAELMVETDLRAIDSHGVSMLPMYEKLREQGTLNMTPERTIMRDTPVLALIDADRGLGHPIAREAMLMACDKARQSGIGAVGVCNSHHFGATGLYAEMAAEQGLLGLVTSSTSVAGVIPTHGANPLLGTNPIAFAAPGRRHPPFLLDMSTSTVAVNKVKVYALNGLELPSGWVVDGQGQAVRDSAQALALCHAQQNGGLTPLGGDTNTGGHKGYGLSVMVQILSSALTGGSFSPVRNQQGVGTVPHNIGHFFLAIDPRAFRAEGELERDVDQMFDILKGSQPASAQRPVQVPGDPERVSRKEREVSGIPMPETLLSQLRAIAENAGVPYALTGS
jgi:LDH2 family malate/lactate/ureidoglycolate dehydrogenase